MTDPTSTAGAQPPPPPPPPPVAGRGGSSGRGLAIAAIAIALIAGILAGVALDRGLVARSHPRAWNAVARARRFPSHVPRRHQPMSDAVARRMSLTPPQRARIDSITARGMAEVDSINREFRPRVRGVLERTRLAVDSVLTPAQREQMRRMFERHAVMMRRMGGRGMVGHPPLRHPSIAPQPPPRRP